MECADDNLQSALAETERFLERWRFAISTEGFVYARPIGRTLVIEDLASFIERLRLICDHEFPDVITIDLCEVVVQKAEWRPMKGLMRRFARSIGARLRTVSTQGRSAGILIVCRCGRKGRPASP